MAKGRIEQEIAVKVTGLDDVKDIDERLDKLGKKKAKLTLDADTGDAAKKIAKVDDEIDALNKRKAELKVTADTTTVERDLQSIFTLTDKLGATSATIVLRDNAKTIEGEIADLVLQLDRLDANDPDVKVTMDQINALETELGQVDAKLREVGERPIDIQTGNTRKNLDDIGKSADSSKSVLANMVGNATQDLGALGGIAGSAGVAIGQMGEYMVDAASGGDKLGNVLGNFAKVAGPIAAIALATQVLSNVVGANAEKSEAAAKATDMWVDAMDAGGDAAANYATALKDADEIMADVSVTNDKVIEQTRKMDQGWSGLEGAWHAIFGGGDDIKGISDLLDKASLTVDQYTQSLAGGVDGATRWTDAVRQSNLSTDEQEQLISAVTTGQKSYSDALEATARNERIFADGSAAHADAVKKATDATDEFIKANKPMSDLPATWATAEAAVRAMQEGIKPSADQMQALIVLAQQYGTDVPGIIGMVTDKFDEQAQAAQETADAAAESAAATVQAQEDMLAAIEETNAGLDEAAIAAEGFQSALDKIDAGSELDFSLMAINTVKSFDDIKGALEGAQEAGVDWSNVDLTPESVDELKGITPELEAVTEAVHGMRESIQTELSAAFDTGGIEGYRDKATFFADQIRDQFVQSFKDAGASEDEAVAKTEELLGALGLLPEQVEIQVKLTQAEAARKTLEIFKSDIDALPTAVSTNIKTLWAKGDTVAALEALNAYLLANGQAPIDIESIINPPPPLDPDDIPTATATVDADTQPAQDAVDLWNANAEAADAQANFDANPDDAEAAVRLWNANANAAKAKATFDANTAPALSKVDGWEANANAARGTGTMGATAQPANAVVDGWEAATNRTTATATANAKLGTYPSSNDIVRAIGPVVVQAKVVAVKLFDLEGGGTAPADGAIAGEAGAEFIREPGRPERLLTGPSWVPPGTRVTSARRTRSILHGGGKRHIPRLAGGGVAPMAAATTSTVVINHTTNVNAAVVGNRYDVAKAVGQGNRDLTRLLGRRGVGVR